MVDLMPRAGNLWNPAGECCPSRQRGLIMPLVPMPQMPLPFGDSPKDSGEWVEILAAAFEDREGTSLSARDFPMSDPMRSETCRFVGRSVQGQDFRSSFGYKECRI